MAGERCVVASNKADADGIVRMEEGRTAESRASAAVFCAVIYSNESLLCFCLPFDPKSYPRASGSFLGKFHGAYDSRFSAATYKAAK